MAAIESNEPSGSRAIPSKMAKKIVCALVLRRQQLYETESSSDSDSTEEWEIALQERGRRQLQPRMVGYGEVIFRYADNEFKSHFRMSKATFEYLHGVIGDDLIRQIKGCPAIPSHQQLLIALWRMATTDTYRSICDRFNVGKATAIRAVRRVARALFARCTRFIRWPSGDRAVKVIRGFETASGFPGVIGAIDGAHIRINAPKENPAEYINRKGYHSIQLQVVCDHRTLITHCYTGHPGSVHDQRVFRQSEVADYLNEPNKFSGDSHLLGDAAYELHERLLTPFRDNGHLTESQVNYNYLHSAARVTAERCFGLLKGRMRSLIDRLPMSRVDLMAEYIVACCVIHNICTRRGDEMTVITIPSRSDDNFPGLHSSSQARNAAVDKRNAIMNILQRRTPGIDRKHPHQ